MNQEKQKGNAAAVVQSTTVKTIRNLKKGNLPSEQESKRSKRSKSYAPTIGGSSGKKGEAKNSPKANLNQSMDSQSQQIHLEQVDRQEQNKNELDQNNSSDDQFENNNNNNNNNNNDRRQNDFRDEKKTIKRKINFQANPTLYGLPADPYNYQPATGEYYNINMDTAINYVLTKGKDLLAWIEAENISQEFIQRNILASRHFNIAYNSFLQKMVNKKLLSHDFKAVTQKSLQKLEKFFRERIEQCRESERIHQAYEDQSKYIHDQFEKRIAELQEKIQIQNKIVID